MAGINPTILGLSSQSSVLDHSAMATLSFKINFHYTLILCKLRIPPSKNVEQSRLHVKMMITAAWVK